MPTAGQFAIEGLPVAFSPGRYPEVALGQLELIRNVRKHAAKVIAWHRQGVLQTTWTRMGEFMKACYGGETARDTRAPAPDGPRRRVRRRRSLVRKATRRAGLQRRWLDFLNGLCAPDVVEGYLRGLADSDRALSRELAELLELIRRYGPDAVAGAVAKAHAAHALGADYVANLLRLQQAPRQPQPPLRLADPPLNERYRCAA